MRTLIFLILFSCTLHAEEDFLWWKGHEKVAGRISDGLVAAQLTAQIVQDLRQPEGVKRIALACTGLQIGTAFAASTITKHFVHRWRPDLSDNRSFWSEHSQAAAVAAGWKYEIGIPITVSTAGFRMAAHKHYLTDVITGIAAGTLSRFAWCRG